MSQKYKILISIIGILIIIGLYQTIIIVPNLNGKTLNEVNQTLAGHDFTVNYTLQETNDSSKLNKVISRNPDFIFKFSDPKIVNVVIGTSMREFTIVEPTNGSNQVGDFITVKGTVNQLKPNETVYLLVQPLPLPTQNRTYEWYVQYPITIKDKVWQCQCQIGRSIDVGRDFKLTAIITTEKLDVGSYGYRFPSNVTERTQDVIVHKVGS